MTMLKLILFESSMNKMSITPKTSLKHGLPGQIDFPERMPARISYKTLYQSRLVTFCIPLNVDWIRSLACKDEKKGAIFVDNTVLTLWKF